MIKSFHTSELKFNFRGQPHTMVARGAAYDKGKVSLVIESDPPIEDMAGFLAGYLAECATRQAGK